MYELASQLDPDSLHAIARYAYAELAMAGVTAVGEFHYLHHDPQGMPYRDRLAMADAVVRAARDAGLRITLLRVLYHRAGAGRPPEGAQRRFADGTVEVGLRDIEQLIERFADDPCVAVGIAPHSVRAVPREWIREAALFARSRGLPLHMNVSEQRREIDECLDEHRQRPLHVLYDDDVLDGHFVAVHATHLVREEAQVLGTSRAFVCLCRTTERDRGDGLPDVQALLGAGSRLCTGVDSHAVSDPFEEARAVELDERSRVEGRLVAAEGPVLLEAATRWGYAAIGIEGRHSEDRVVLDATDPALVGADVASLDDAVVFGAGPRSVLDVDVAGEAIVRGGVHREWDAIRSQYLQTIKKLGV